MKKTTIYLCVLFLILNGFNAIEAQGVVWSNYFSNETSGIYSDPVKMLATVDDGLVALFHDEIVRFSQIDGAIEWVMPTGGNNFIISSEGDIWVVSHTSSEYYTPVINKLNPSGEEEFSITEFPIENIQMRTILSLFEDGDKIVFYGYALFTNTYMPVVMVFDKFGNLLLQRILPEEVSYSFAEYTENIFYEFSFFFKANNLSLAGKLNDSYYFTTYDASATLTDPAYCLNEVQQTIYAHYLSPVDLSTLYRENIDQLHIENQITPEYYPYCSNFAYIENIYCNVFSPQGYKSIMKRMNDFDVSLNLSELEIDGNHFKNFVSNLAPEIEPYVSLNYKNEWVKDILSLGNKKIAVVNMFVPVEFGGWWISLPNSLPIFNNFYASAFIIVNEDGTEYCTRKLENYSFCESIAASNDAGEFFVLQRPTDLQSGLTLSKYAMSCTDAIDALTYHIPSWPPDTVTLCGNIDYTIQIDSPYYVQNDSIYPLNANQYQFSLQNDQYYQPLSLTDSNYIILSWDNFNTHYSDTLLLYPVITNNSNNSPLQTAPDFPPLVIIKPPLELTVSIAIDCSDEEFTAGCDNDQDYFINPTLIITMLNAESDTVDGRYEFNFYLDQVSPYNLLPNIFYPDDFQSNLLVIAPQLPYFTDYVHQVIFAITDHLCETTYYFTTDIRCFIDGFHDFINSVHLDYVPYCNMLSILPSNFNNDLISQCSGISTGYLLFQTYTPLASGQALNQPLLNELSPLNIYYFPQFETTVNPALDYSNDIYTYYSPLLYTDNNNNGWDLSDTQTLYGVVRVLLQGEQIQFNLALDEISLPEPVSSCDYNGSDLVRNIRLHSDNAEGELVALAINGMQTGLDTIITTYIPFMGNTDIITLPQNWLAESSLQITINTTDVDCFYSATQSFALSPPDPASWASPWYPTPLFIEEASFCADQSLSASVPCTFDAEAYIHSIGDSLGITTPEDHYYNIAYHLEILDADNQWQPIASSEDGVFTPDQYAGYTDSLFQISILAMDHNNLPVLGPDALVQYSYTEPVISLGNDTMLLTGDSLYLDFSDWPGSFLWQDGSSSNTYTITESGSYTLTYTDENGCVTSDELDVSFTSGIGDNPSPLIHLFPNPAGDILYISFSGSDHIENVIIIDSQGREAQRIKSMDDGSINIESLSDGIYFIRIETSTATCYEKFIKE